MENYKEDKNVILSGGFECERAFGCYDFEFYVDDNATDEEIEAKVEETMQISHHYSVEEGYEEYTEVCYRKKNRY